MKFSKKEKILFYIIISLLTIFLLRSFVFRPFANKLFSLNQKICLEEANFKKGLILLSRRKDVEQEYKGYQPYLNIKGSDEEITAELLKEIEQIAGRAELSLTNIQPQAQKKKKAKGEYKEYNVQLRFESHMDGVVNFLYNLHRSRFLLRVKRLSLNRKDEKLETLKGEMIISGVRIK
ncbi:MAG: hypothetical protein B5M48_01770 [Candidatus Omnitrophica bacterium 4484_213]|nr:MAG: hypothetical protein B5M48_01770 [Candidatus Omnitrophica bacterium 4484_213]